MRRVEVAVVGAGIMGASAAWNLARRGRSVALFEQHELGHRRGSSHGAARIFRFAYQQPDYVRLAQRALPLWRTIEHEMGESLLRTTGGLDLGPQQNLEPIAAALAECGADFNWLSAGELPREFGYMRLPEGWAALYQPDAGVLQADRAWLGLAEMARRSGADVREGTRVTALRAAGDGVRVETSAGDWTADAVVIANAGWSAALLNSLDLSVPITVTREQVLYYPVSCDLRLLPVIWHATAASPEFYFLPNGVGELKVGEHGTGPVVDPDSEGQVDEARLGRVRELVSAYLPGVSAPPSGADVCLYAGTPDDDFVVDRVGPIVLGMGFGGHGFKFGSIVGEMLADLAEGAQPAWPRFSRERFAQVDRVSL